MHVPAFLSDEYFGNPLSAYVAAGATFLATVGAFVFVRRLILRRLPALAADLLRQIGVFECGVVALYFAARPLETPERFDQVLHGLLVLVVAFRAVTLSTTVAGYAVRRSILADGDDAAHRATASTVAAVVRGLLWIAGALFALSNLGYNVSSMLAGLGIGGIAVALGAQAVLGDLFSALAIYLDKPFAVGDSVKIGDFFGTVEHIGLKTTRVRSLGGELLIFANSSLTNARLQNFRQMTERRALITFSVPLDTPAAVLKRLPGQIQAIVQRTPGTRFDRAHLAAFRESGLEYEAAFYVLSPDYTAYMDGQQAVLLGILDALRADRIPLAQPTRTVMVTSGKLA